jgi:ABC-2 type transport system permease protein
MNKIFLITRREFLSRVRKKSFIVMSIIAPLIFGGFISMMAYFGANGDSEVKEIAVIDNTQTLINKIPDNKSLKFNYLTDMDINSMKLALNKSKYAGILYITKDTDDLAGVFQYYSYSQPGISTVQYISNVVENELRDIKLRKMKMGNLDSLLNAAKTRINLQTIKMSQSGEEKSGSSMMSMGLAYIGSLLIYMFILMYGVQVMRGVIEEKTNRIVEVIISSVKPFELMMGKIFGVALTALLQFVIWVVFSVAVFYVAKEMFMPNMSPAGLNTPGASAQVIAQLQTAQAGNDNTTQIFNMIAAFNYAKVLLLFLFYFITGYLLYSSLFAAVGSAVDNEADTQQFVFPVTLPLIAGIMIMVQAFQYPDSPVAVWGSIIPLTAPIVMMARIPYEVPWEQLVLSMSLMILTFLGAVWFAAKIYRTGILMYGKKVTFKEMLKWLWYKN